VRKIWTDEAWQEYLHWQSVDRKALRRINQLIRDIDRGGNEGLGAPEPLRGDLSGLWSRRIDASNRLVYRVVGDTIEIAQCGSHYRDR
jgi:toxin YoeB